MIVSHTAADSLYERQSRILGSRFNLPSEMFESPKFYLDKGRHSDAEAD